MLLRCAALTANCLIVASCAHGGFADVDLDELPGAARYPAADGLVLFERRSVELRIGDEGAPVAEELVHLRQRVFTEAGRKRLPFSVYLMRPFQELLELEARVITPSGEERRLGRDDAVDAPAYGGSVLYDDSRVIHLPLADVPLGSVVDVRYRMLHKEPLLFGFVHGFESHFPALESQLSVHMPAGWRIEHRGFVLDEDVELSPTKTTDERGERVTFTRHDLAPLPRERNAPSRQFPGTLVVVRLARWLEGGRVVDAHEDERALSRWMYERTHERAAPTPAIRALADTVLAQCPDDPREKAKRLYAWTRDNITYCAIEIGYGGWFPHASSDTERLRYGDCKDKANLLRSLLLTQGIESHVASIYNHGGLPRPFRFPTMVGNANHAILVVDLAEGRVAMDPTTRTVPFGRLPFGDQGAELLPFTREGAPLWRTPVDEPETNVIETGLSLVLRPGKGTVGDFDMTLRGVFADRLRDQLLRTTVSGIPEVIDRWVPVHTDEVTDVVLVGASPPLEPTPVSARGKIDGHGELSDDLSFFLFRLSDYLFDVVPSLPAGERRTPVLLGPPSRKRDVITVRVPEGTTVGALPPPVTLESAVGRYVYDASLLDDGSLRYERTFVLRQSVVRPAEYAALRAFFDEIASAEARTVVLRFDGERSGS